jgi:hypothetical protein
MIKTSVADVPVVVKRVKETPVSRDAKTVLESFGMDTDHHIPRFQKEEFFYDGTHYDNIVRYCVDWALHLNFYAVRDNTDTRRETLRAMRDCKRNRHVTQTLSDVLQENITSSCPTRTGLVYKWSAYPNKDAFIKNATSSTRYIASTSA